MSKDHKEGFKCAIWGTPLKYEKVSSATLIKEGKKNNATPTQKTIFSRLLENDYSPSVQKMLDSNNKYKVYNPKAGGHYIISGKFLCSVSNSGACNQDRSRRFELDEKMKIRVSGYIASENLKSLSKKDLNVKVPNLDNTITNTNDLEKLPLISNQDKKANLLLLGITKLCPRKGEPIVYNSRFYDQVPYDPGPLESDLKFYSKAITYPNTLIPFLSAYSYCSDVQEFNFLLDKVLVEELKFLEKKTYFPTSEEGSESEEEIDEVKITAKGWRKIEELENNTPNKNSKKVFIAMWMDTSMGKLKLSIEKAVRKAGYEPLRIDDKKDSDRIDDDILSEIEKARFVVCDVTSSDPEKPRSSVYFEAGYAKGKGIPVIWTCKREMGDVHSNSFDTRQYHCIFWEEDKMEDFETELTGRITSRLKSKL